MAAFKRLRAALTGEKAEKDDSKFDKNPLMPSNIVRFSCGLIVPIIKPTESKDTNALCKAIHAAKGIKQRAVDATAHNPSLRALEPSMIAASDDCMPEFSDDDFPLTFTWPANVDTLDAVESIRRFQRHIPVELVLDEAHADEWHVVQAKPFSIAPLCHNISLFVDVHRLSHNAITTFVTTLVMERMETKEQRLERLLSHRKAIEVMVPGATSQTLSTRGVDATGLVRRWLSEDIFAWVLHAKAMALPGVFDGIRVLELGAGSSALITATLCAIARNCTLCATDGNVDVARRLCVQALWMHSICGSSNHNHIIADCVVWENKKARERCDLTGFAYPMSALAVGNSSDSHAQRLDASYDVVIAADTAFFEDFHADQLLCIYVALQGMPHAFNFTTPASTTDACTAVDTCRSDAEEPWLSKKSDISCKQAWIFAPERGGSLSRLIATARNMRVCHTRGDTFEPAFHVSVHERYDETIYAAHERALEVNAEYSPDIHFPKLVVLRIAAVCTTTTTTTG